MKLTSCLHPALYIPYDKDASGALSLPSELKAEIRINVLTIFSFTNQG